MLSIKSFYYLNFNFVQRFEKVFTFSNQHPGGFFLLTARIVPLVVLFAASTNLQAEGFERKAATASDYIIAEGSTSPDGRYGVAYLKTAPDGPGMAKNYVVAIKPFQIIAEVHGDGMQADSPRRTLEAQWTADSSAVVAITRHDKWNLIVGCSYVALHDGKVARHIDLLKEMNTQLLEDFSKSKGEGYNDHLPFILTDSELTFAADGKSVKVESAATNDPNTARNICWVAEFEGTLNVTDGKWQIQKLKSEVTKNF